MLLALLLGCAHLRDDKTVCPESRNVRCLTREVCAIDEARGCQVCRCEAAAVTGPDGKPAPPGPDQR